jgi:hypothetical protein
MPWRVSLSGLAALSLLALSAVTVMAAASRPSPWVELDSGSHGNFLWSVKAKLREGPMGEGPLGAQRPCLLVTASWQSSRLEYHRSKYRECAPGTALRRSGPPLVASGMQASTGAPAQISAVGMVFAPAARRVRVTFSGGNTKTIRLRNFDPAQTGDPALGRLRYAAFTVHGSWCAERIVSFGAGAAMLWDSGVDGYACGSGAEGPPHFEG